MAVSRANSVDLVYGDFHTTKSSRLGDIAEYWYEQTGKPARLVSSDSGGWDVIQYLVDAEVIFPFKMTSTRPNPLATIRKLTQGYWPEDPQDPNSPISAKLDLSGTSVLLIDGITSICDMLMRFHTSAVKKDGPDKVTGTAVRIAGVPKDNYIEDGDFLRRITSQTDYGEIQRSAQEFCNNLSFLPIPAALTALECKAEDDDNRVVRGPKFIGQALTPVCGAWFANMVHLDLLPVRVKGADGVESEEARPFMFLKPHYDARDPLKIRYPAQVRVAKNLWDKVPLRMEPDMKKLYKALEEIRQEAARTVVAVRDRAAEARV